MKNPRPIRTILQAIGGIIAVIAVLTAIVGGLTGHRQVFGYAFIVAVIIGTAVVLPLVFANPRTDP